MAKISGRNLTVVGNNSFTTMIMNEIKKGNFYSAELWNGKVDDSDAVLIAEEKPFMNDNFLMLRNAGVKECFVLQKESPCWFNEDGSFCEHALQYIDLDGEKAAMRYLEFHLNDHCNLRCKGCSHFADLVRKENFVTLDSVREQFRNVERVFQLSMLRLMGGEPLLHPNLKEILYLTREIFSDTRIYVVTNGLLVQNLDDETIKAFTDNNISLWLTLYKPTYQIAENITRFANEHGIPCYWGEEGEKDWHKVAQVETFRECLTLNKHESNQKKSCVNPLSWILRDGKVSKCPYPPMIHVLNDSFGCNFQVEAGDRIDVAKLSPSDSWYVIEKLNGEIPFCKYCADECAEICWESHAAAPQLNDYLAK